MQEKFFLTPPVVFFLMLAGVGIFAGLLSRISHRARKDGRESKKAYACGEDFNGHLIQPDYSQFFPFAFFFTLLHVVALFITTVPLQTVETFAIAVVYISGAVVGLSILLRK